MPKPKPNLIAHLALANLPKHNELVTSLLAYRHHMTEGFRHVWICVTDESGWHLVDTQASIIGAFARIGIDKGGDNKILHDEATRAIGKIRRYLEAGAPDYAVD